MEPETGQLYQIELSNSDTYTGYAMDGRFVSTDGRTILKGSEFTSVAKFRELESEDQAKEKP